MTTNLAPWRVTSMTPLIAGESLDGYVARVAAAHHMPRLADITEVAGAAATARQHATFCEEAQLEVLADCLRVDVGTLRLHSPLWSERAETLNFFGTPVPRDFLQFTHRRFSPLALSQSPHHRGLWQSRILPICTETWVYLQDRCPNPVCNRQQAWRRTTGIDLCDFCGEPLTRAEARAVPEELRDSVEKLIGLIHPDPECRAASRQLLPPRLAQLGGGELLELACELAPIIDPRAADPLGMRTLSMAVAEDVVLPAIAQTWPFLSSWPHGFEQFLIDRLNQNQRSMAAAKRDIVYRLLYKSRKRKLSRSVLDVIDEFADRCRAARTEGVTIAEAIKLTGGRQPALFAMRRSGELPSILALDGCRFQPLIEKRAIEQMVERNRPRERLTRAAERLGVPSYTIHELAHDGLLEAAPLPPGCRGQIAVYQASLTDLSERLHAKLGEPTEGEGINLALLMKRLGGRPKPWSRIFAAILSGMLVARLTPRKMPLAKRIMVAHADVLALPIFAEREDMVWDGVNVLKADLADMMNIRPENFPSYCDFLLGPGDHLRDIPMIEALRLARTYVNTSELGHRLGMHHTGARHLAEFRGVKVAFGGLYHRADAEKRLLGSGPASSASKAQCSTDNGVHQDDHRIILHSLVNPRGRLRLPAYFRRQMGLSLGGKVLFEEVEGGIMMRNATRVR